MNMSATKQINLSNKRVVELGAGHGLASIAAAKLGADECHCTDGDATSCALAGRLGKSCFLRKQVPSEKQLYYKPSIYTNFELRSRSFAAFQKGTFTLSEENVAANGVEGTVTVTRVLWGDAEMQRSISPPFDVVIAADVAAVVYEGAFDDLVACLRGGWVARLVATLIWNLDAPLLSVCR